jgi:hypothetical protein
MAFSDCGQIAAAGDDAGGRLRCLGFSQAWVICIRIRIRDQLAWTGANLRSLLASPHLVAFGIVVTRMLAI